MRHSSLLDLGLWPNSVALGKTQERTIPKQEVTRAPIAASSAQAAFLSLAHSSKSKTQKS